jgi:hypothetical protein
MMSASGTYPTLPPKLTMSVPQTKPDVAGEPFRSHRLAACPLAIPWIRVWASFANAVLSVATGPLF